MLLTKIFSILTIYIEFRVRIKLSCQILLTLHFLRFLNLWRKFDLIFPVSFVFFDFCLSFFLFVNHDLSFGRKCVFLLELIIDFLNLETEIGFYLILNFSLLSQLSNGSKIFSFAILAFCQLNTSLRCWLVVDSAHFDIEFSLRGLWLRLSKLMWTQNTFNLLICCQILLFSRFALKADRLFFLVPFFLLLNFFILHRRLLWVTLAFVFEMLNMFRLAHSRSNRRLWVKDYDSFSKIFCTARRNCFLNRLFPRVWIFHGKWHRVLRLLEVFFF